MKLDILMHYDVNETTGEVTFIGKEEITVDTAAKAVKTTKKSTSKIEENLEPLITLEPNKLVLTKGAVQMLDICPDCRVDIKYKKKGKQTVPVIGTDTAFKTKGGNLLTKSNTVSYRGSANTKLAEYGTVFKLEQSEDDGIYYLIGDKKVDHISDLDTIDITEELDIETLDTIDLESNKELSGFDFTL
jgi:hypothetical protein